MTRKTNKTITKGANSLQFISEDEIEQEINDAQASMELNPFVRWAKFILADDQPNGNGERLPVEEFDNVIKSGINMPIKMAEGRIEEDHSNASPIGVITSLKKEFINGINRIVGLAALWSVERPGDVAYLKTKSDNGEPVDVSYELKVADKIRNGNSIDLVGASLTAVTVVGRPAYLGRTPILAIASMEWTDEYINNLPDSSFLYIERGGDLEGKPKESRYFPIKNDKGILDVSQLKVVLTEAENSKIPEKYLGSIKDIVTSLLAKVDSGASLLQISEEVAPLENNIVEEDTVELEQLKQRVSELETELANTKSSLTEKEQALTKANESLASLSGEKDSITTELEELRTFKKEIDDEVAKVEKLDAIKAKFSEASLNKEDSYFAENSEKLLNLSSDALDFMIQELVAFTKTSTQASLEDSKRFPNFSGDVSEISISEIAKALRERKSKK